MNLPHSDQQSLDQALEDMTMQMEDMTCGETPRPPTPIPQEAEVLIPTITWRRLEQYRYVNGNGIVADPDNEEEDFYTDNEAGEEEEDPTYGNCGYRCDGRCQLCGNGGFDMSDEI